MLVFPYPSPLFLLFFLKYKPYFSTFFSLPLGMRSVKNDKLSITSSCDLFVNKAVLSFNYYNSIF